MSFRIEEKLLINRSHIYDFKKFLNSKGYTKLYKDRSLKSLYFENYNNQMFHDSEEGILPRKKIRIRTYPENSLPSSQYFLEIKVSSVEGRYKKVKKIDLNYLTKVSRHGLYDHIYGPCFPKLYVCYDREYYKCNDSRITIDRNILYQNYKNEFRSKPEINVLIEVKSSFNKNLDVLRNEFPFQRIRSSKYCSGFQKLFHQL